jgi:hypothetical protein
MFVSKNDKMSSPTFNTSLISDLIKRSVESNILAELMGKVSSDEKAILFLFYVNPRNINSSSWRSFILLLYKEVH